MQELLSFYQNRIKKNSALLGDVKKKLFASSMIRLTVFLLSVVGLYFFFDQIKIVTGIVIVTIILFLFLVSRHSDLQYQKAKLRSLVKINEQEIAVLQRKYFDLPEGNEYKDPSHHFAQDIDLFGRGSFYQYINRTVLPAGSERLASVLKENVITDVVEKQNAVQELGNMPEWRQEFLAIGGLTQSETELNALISWLKNYKSFVPKTMRYIPLVFSLASIGALALFFLDQIPESFLIYWVLFGLMVTGIFTRKITKLGNDAGKLQSTFQQYGKLVAILEETSFKSTLLHHQKERLKAENKNASAVLEQFSKLLANLDQNNNFIYLIFGNGLFLRGLTTCFNIEKWISANKDFVKDWFDVISFFDAQITLGNFAFNHPDYTFPKINKDGNIKTEGAGHPLLHPQKSVLNDYEIKKEEFFIITGANMAGKSTFLRTVSLQIVMANIGLPVCAKNVAYTPIKLITSMRTTDSLTDDESYFFSELKRLKFLVDEIQEDRYFIVLDEILKGTNSTDKAEGSRKFVERLVASKATGIIATHDLSLCEIAEELPQVKNHYFDAEIIADELHFDYKFKKGICQNMNASFLLKKMEIVD
ncbi:MutS-related protein [Maribacter sp. 2210JD10-5]|uniref:MutS-related protein n=1 Tax=Maribacter sp. 2210JD10-5 TaxID=3386272 RepID=UPI0039BC79E4